MSYFAKAWRCTALEDRLEMAGSAKAAWSPRTNSSGPNRLSCVKMCTQNPGTIIATISADSA